MTTVIVTCDSVDLFISAGQAHCANWQVVEYTDASNMATVLDHYFGFDLEIFLLVSGFLVVTWIVAFTTGMVARTIGRV